MENGQIVHTPNESRIIEIDDKMLTINEDMVFDRFFMDEHEIVVIDLEKIDSDFGDQLLYTKETLNNDGEYVLEVLNEEEMQKALRVKETLQHIFEEDNKNE